MQKIVNCPKCRTPLGLPEGAKSIRCAICGAVTAIAKNDGSSSSGATMASNFGDFVNSIFSIGKHARRPNPHKYSPLPPATNGSKRAVLCGICYRGRKYKLEGCINDIKCIKYLLITRFRFPEASIVVLSGKILTSLLQKHFTCQFSCVCD
eukprot:Gb_39847 [translate_table: standard]